MSGPSSSWPSWIVLREEVPVFDAGHKDQEDLIMGAANKERTDIEEGSWLLSRVMLDAHLVEPPEISTLSVRAEVEVLERGIMCYVESAVKNIVVINLDLAFERVFVLIYDAAKNSLSLAPTAMESFFGSDFNPRSTPPYRFLMRSAVLPRDDGSYDLADFGFRFERFGHDALSPSGILFRWSSSSSTSPVKWTQQEARFNPLTTLPMCHRRQPYYNVDVAFTFKGRAFWADLLLGAVVCDLLSTAGDACAELDFIHLPTECQGRDFSESYPKERRTMGPVGDSVKFISVITINGDNPDNDTCPSDVVVRSWTLTPDLCKWMRDDDMELPLRQLWESEAYKRERLPESVPLNPILKVDENGVIYLLLGDYFIDWRRKLLLCREKMEYVIRVDMGSKTLLSCSHRPITDGLPVPECAEVPPPKGFFPVRPNMLGAEFCAHHTESSDHLLHKKKRSRPLLCCDV